MARGRQCAGLTRPAAWSPLAAAGPGWGPGSSVAFKFATAGAAKAAGRTVPCPDHAFKFGAAPRPAGRRASARVSSLSDINLNVRCPTVWHSGTGSLLQAVYFFFLDGNERAVLLPLRD